MCQALQILHNMAPFTSLTSFPTTLPVIHTTLHRPPSYSEYPTHESVLQISIFYFLSQISSWLMDNSFTSFRSLFICNHLTEPPHQKLQLHTQSQHSLFSFPATFFSISIIIF